MHGVSLERMVDTPPGALRRRDFLTGSAALLAGLALPACGSRRLPFTAPNSARHAAFFVPGYRTDVAAHRGDAAEIAPALRRTLPSDYDGRVTLLTRLSERDGSVKRALLPINGHAICVTERGPRAFWNSMNEGHFLSFDPASLEVDVIARPRGDDFIGAGHGEYTADGRYLLAVERKRYGRLDVRPEDQFGQITVRDAESLAVLDVIGTHGVSPHEANLLEDGKHVAIANYGSTNIPAPGERPHMLEPSLTVVELASGKLVYKKVGPNLGFEVRHIAAHRLDRIAAVLVREGNDHDGREYMAARDTGIYEPDFSAESGYAYLPAPVQAYDATQPEAAPRALLPENTQLSRHGQSILYDPTHDEVIATFATSHCLIVYAGGGGIKRVIHTDRFGLRYPRGIALHPDGHHYAVAGSWQGLHVLERGNHTPVPERAIHAVFFDHSHLAALGEA